MKQINIKLDVPEGFVLDKVETEGDNIVASIKEKPEFKRGDVIRREETGGHNDVIYIMNSKEGCRYSHFALYRIDQHALVFQTTPIATGNERLATLSEAQLLFDALAKEGKKWNPETLQIEDIEKDILVPDNIGIYQSKNAINGGDNLLIALNDQQFLGFNTDESKWFVRTGVYSFNRVQCKLIPCKREDLNAGDTAFTSNCAIPVFGAISDYCKVLDDGNVVYSDGLDIKVRQWCNRDLKWYKVVPVK